MLFCKFEFISSQMSKKYILALDQGTTSSRSVIVDELGEIIAIEQQEFRQIFPKSGWIEHNALEILETQLSTLKKVVTAAKINVKDIVGLGITNQRETTVVWDKTTGKPIYKAIVWQDKRTADFCKELKKKELEEYVKKNTSRRESLFLIKPNIRITYIFFSF